MKKARIPKESENDTFFSRDQQNENDRQVKGFFQSQCHTEIFKQLWDAVFPEDIFIYGWMSSCSMRKMINNVFPSCAIWPRPRQEYILNQQRSDWRIIFRKVFFLQNKTIGAGGFLVEFLILNVYFTYI